LIAIQGVITRKKVDCRIKRKFKGTSAKKKMPKRDTYKLDGDFIKRLLRHRGWSQADLAKAAGLTEVTISNKLKGEPAEAHTLNSIAAMFGVPPNILCAMPAGHRRADTLPLTVAAYGGRRNPRRP
jgi:DNA-binding XRE family transcriptional regulator